LTEPRESKSMTIGKTSPMQRFSISALSIAICLSSGWARSQEPASEPAAAAEPAPAPATAPAPARWSIHGGINLRTDLGTHPLRIDGGIRFRKLDAILVLDPMFFLDKQSSTDVLFEWRGDSGISPVLGWRFNTIGLVDGTQVQENLILGGAADLPSFWEGRVRGQAGLELAMMLVKHGGGGPVETIGFSSGREFVDFVNFALFLRVEIGTKP
jgi:hypothetical protein